MSRSEPTLAIIIPSLHGEIDALRASIAAQTLQPDAIEVVIGVRPNGRARNYGVARTQSDIVAFIDDDAVLGHPRVLETLVVTLMNHPNADIVGASRILPPDASPWQQRVAREVPRIEHPIVTAPLETNPDPPSYYCEVTTTCCVMRRTLFEEAGRFCETLLRGVDTEFFVRVRRLGAVFVLAPHTWVYHSAPPTLRALLHKHFLYGIGFAQEVRRDPSRARGRYLHTPLHAVAYVLLRTLLLLPNMIIPYSFAAPSWTPAFKPLKALTSYGAALGYVGGWYLPLHHGNMNHAQSNRRLV